MPPRPELAADTSAAKWLKASLPEKYGFRVRDWVPNHLDHVARIADLGGGWPGDVDLSPLLGLLERHTDSDQRCCFCTWDGYGWINGGHSVVLFGPPGDGQHIQLSSGLPSTAVGAAMFSLGMRDYVLFQGPLRSMLEFGWRGDEVVANEHPELAQTPAAEFSPEVPDLMWPQERDWFFGTDTDFEWAYLSGSEDLIAEAVASIPGTTRVDLGENVD